MFELSFEAILVGIVQILLMAACGFTLVRTKFMDQDGLNFLSRLVINFLIPLLIVYQLTTYLDFARVHDWWVFPSIFVVMAVISLAVAKLIFIGHLNHPLRPKFSAMMCFMNSGFIPLLLVNNLGLGEQAQVLMIYIFLFLIAFDTGTWSLGVWLLTGGGKKFDFKNILNPPLITTVVMVVAVMTGLSKFIPHIILEPMGRLGGCSLPMVMLVLGGNLASIDLRKVDMKEVTLVCLAKLVLLPMIALVFLMNVTIDPLIGLLIMIEAAMPAAVSLSLIARHYKVPDTDFINEGIFFTHIFAIVTVPFFLYLFGMTVSPR